jgi:hypothetical protein
VIVSEEEAKTKRCCGPGGSGERVKLSRDHLFADRICISSACMAWKRAVHAPDRDEHGMLTGTVTESKTHGYCGYAGG